MHASNTSEWSSSGISNCKLLMPLSMTIGEDFIQGSGTPIENGLELEASYFMPLKSLSRAVVTCLIASTANGRIL